VRPIDSGRTGDLESPYIGFDHDLRQFWHLDLRLPAESGVGLRRIADEGVNVGGATIEFIESNVLLPVESDLIDFL